jgi:hypothetical protein
MFRWEAAKADRLELGSRNPKSKDGKGKQTVQSPSGNNAGRLPHLRDLDACNNSLSTLRRCAR